jgi:hypothetical protein
MKKVVYFLRVLVYNNPVSNNMTTTDITSAVATVSLYRSLNNRFVDDADDRQRHITFRCMTEYSQDNTPEWLFEATNAPESFLDAEQMFVRQTFADAKLHSLSRGDVIGINGTFYKCKMVGWEKVPHFNDTIEH